MELLFSYGTLQQPELQLHLFGRYLNGKKDRLSGYKVFEIEIKEEHFLAMGEKSIQLIARPTGNCKDFIEGMLLELEEEELRLSDGYEPPEYKRLLVQLDSGLDAWIYAGVL